MDRLEQLALAIVAGEVKVLPGLLSRAIKEGYTPQLILYDGLLSGMEVISDKYREDMIYIPDVLMGARAMQVGLKLIKPLMAAEKLTDKGKIVIGTVAGDIHDIGKNLVILLLESFGINVVDLGVDVTPENFVNAIKKHQPGVVGLSSLLTTTLPAMRETVEAIEMAGIRDQVKILIGGGPVTRTLTSEIGADAYASDARRGAEVAVKLLQEMGDRPFTGGCATKVAGN